MARTRRSFLKMMGVGTAAAATAHLWIPRKAAAQTAARGDVKHLIYLHLTGGFRFTCAFNGDVGGQFNPFGLASGVPSGVDWGPSALLARTGWLTDELAGFGMRSMASFADQIAVAPCVDHEPLAGGADGNHGTGLQRFLTGFPGGPASFFTMINYGLRDAVAQAQMEGQTVLPAFSFGSAGMATGTGQFAAYRPPVIQGDGFGDFGFDSSSLPVWAQELSEERDVDFRDGVNARHYDQVEAYLQSRQVTEEFAAIFNDPLLKVDQGSAEVVDGISNQQLTQMLGNNRAGRDAALALRLFHFGSPAVYLTQGGYDFHSDEDDSLPPRLDDLNRVVSGLEVALKQMTHPSGGSYWDNTLIVMGSEFGRTARGGRFNSAQGSDHNSDYATRWMSMPMMGGVIDAAGIGGRRFGETRASDLDAVGTVYSYRSMLKTMLDVLGADHDDLFPGDEPILDFFG